MFGPNINLKKNRPLFLTTISNKLLLFPWYAEGNIDTCLIDHILLLYKAALIHDLLL